MPKKYYNIEFVSKFGYKSNATGSIKYRSKESIIIDMNDEKIDFVIKRSNITKIIRLKKHGKDTINKRAKGFESS